ncbi:RNA-directed DNA polymerase, eukaryota [Tanacetum coccineum]
MVNLDADDEDDVEEQTQANTRWTRDEETLLAETWVEVSQNDEIGNDRSNEAFWNHIMEDLNTATKSSPLCEQEAEGSRSGPKRRRTYIRREREHAEQQLLDDYFGDDEILPKYTEENFRRRQRNDATDRLSIGPILKCTSAIRRLAYGTAPDAFDEYLQIAERANNDLNVLYGSPLFDDELADTAPKCPFVVNGHTYRKGYYLADDIYPTWFTFVKTFSVARDEKTLKFKRVQESARKDIERAFGIEGQWSRSKRSIEMRVSIGKAGCSYACSDPLLLTPLCCDDIHEVTPRVSALAGVTDWYQSQVIENLVMSPPARASRAKFHWGIAFATGLKRFTDPVTKLRMKHTNRRVRIPKGYHSSKEEVEPSNMNGWLIEDEDEPIGYEASDKEVELDLESTARSKPKRKKLKKTTKAIPDRTFHNCPYCPKC